jgi:4a-hydroxytetrahydrobiopterin dehydratase
MKASGLQGGHPMDLGSERCEACRPDSPQVPATEEQSLLEQIPDWKLVEVNGVKHLKRVIKVKGWRPAVALTNQIATLADEADHHPAILTEWGKVTVEWWTHAIKGLHRNDFIMAAKVDGLLNKD